MTNQTWINIEVVAALPERQVLLRFPVAPGSTVADAIAEARSQLTLKLPDFEIDLERVGVFGQRCALDHTLEAGDRVELYRPLTADPKEIRRQLAALESAKRRNR